MKKTVKLLIFILTFCLFITNIKALEANESFDNDNKIEFPETINIDGENEINIKDVTNYLAYYQIITNVTDNEEFNDLYTEYLNSKEEYQEELDDEIYNLINEDNWKEINSNIVTLDKNDYDNAKTNVMLLKLIDQDGENVIYDYKIFEISNTEKVDNSNTGIDDSFIYIAPLTIIIGALLITRKKQYN